MDLTSWILKTASHALEVKASEGEWVAQVTEVFLHFMLPDPGLILPQQTCRFPCSHPFWREAGSIQARHCPVPDQRSSVHRHQLHSADNRGTKTSHSWLPPLLYDIRHRFGGPPRVSVQHSSPRRPQEVALTERWALLCVSSSLEPRCTNVVDFTLTNQQNGLKDLRITQMQTTSEKEKTGRGTIIKGLPQKRKWVQGHFYSRGQREHF